jgi:hypothetical protein
MDTATNSSKLIFDRNIENCHLISFKGVISVFIFGKENLKKCFEELEAQVNIFSFLS